MPAPEVQSWQYSFAGSITLVFASDVGLCFGQPQLRGDRRLEGPRRGTEDQGRAPRARSGVTGGRLRRMGQGEARGVRPRTTLSSLAESLNDGRQPDGEVAANLESEIRKMYEVDGRRFRVALLATEVPASRGTRPAAQSVTAAHSGRNATGPDERRNSDERIVFR